MQEAENILETLDVDGDSSADGFGVQYATVTSLGLTITVTSPLIASV